MDRNESQWRRAIPGEGILQNQLHVWRADLDLPKMQVDSLQAILSTDEIERAGRFHFDTHKNRYIIARGILRQILGNYLAKDPGKLRFDYTTKGKPLLATNAGSATLSFNLSHSGAFVLYAITLNRNIGIDIEHLSHEVSFMQIAQRFFSQGEISLLEGTDKNNMHELFFRYWTRKEAFLKAMGEGISFPMEKVDVSLINGTDLSPVTLVGDERESARWYVKDLFPAPGYAAAVAVEGGNCDISYLRYSM